MNTVPHRGAGLRRALTASLAVGITLGVAASANAAFPGANGKIAVNAITDDGDALTEFDRDDIYTVNPDGTGLVNLTNTVGVSENAADWSPDGSKIAFTRLGAPGDGVWIMSADGSGQTLIPGTGNARLQSPATVSWSPDGTMIAYSLTGGGIRIVKLDGTIVRTLAPAGLSEYGGVEWSPDGTQIVFDARPDDPTPPEIFRMAADGTGSPTRLTDNTVFDTAPDWSPDGATITWNTNVGGNPVIATMPADDGDPETNVTPTNNQSYRPAFSPDGTKIAHSARTSGSDFVLRTVTPFTSPPVVVFVGSSPIVLRDMDSADWQPVKPTGVQPLTVTKTATTSVSREIRWQVLKSVSTKAGWDAKDGSLRVDYRVEVKKTPVIGSPIAFGRITVANPNTVPAAITVSDVLPGAACELIDPATSVAPVAGLLLKAGASKEFIYSCAFTTVPTAPLTNTATVAWSAGGTTQAPVSGTAAVDFSDPLVEEIGPRAVTVTDTMAGEKTKVLAEELTEAKIFRYRKFIKPSKKCETYTNTARLIAVRVIEPLGQGLPEIPVPSLVIDDDHTSVRVCPQVKDEDPSPKDPPVVTVDNGDGAKPVDTKPADNPRGGVITDPKGGPAKLRITKTPSVKATAKGGIVIWAITVQNTGKSDLDDVVITDRLPKGLRAVTDAKAPLQKAKRGKRVVSFSVGDLLVGQSVTVNVATRAGKTGRICNTARAEADNSRSHTSVACIRVGAPVKAAAG